MTPRGPFALPLAGNLPWFLPDKLGFLSRSAAGYGDVVKLHIGEPTYLLTRAEDIQYVLIDNATNYDKTWRLTSERGKRLSGSGLQTSAGPAHLKQRRLLQPEFSRRSIEAFLPVMLNRVERRRATWREGAQVNLAAEMESLTLSIIIGALFGPDYIDPALEEAITIRRAYIEYVYGSLLPYPEAWPLPLVRRYGQAMSYIESVIRREIRQPSSPYGMAARLASLKYPDGSSMTEDQVRDELLSLTSTGYETIGDALAWTLYLLARHRGVEAKVLAEFAGVLGGRAPTPDDLAQLTYTRQVLNESMRLYPPTWIFVRMALGADTLPSGAPVRAGHKLYLSQYVVHRHPRYYPDPDRFDPARFTPEAMSARPRFSYFPFGGGQRLCIGEQFAVLEMQAVLSQLLPAFRFDLADDAITPRPTITLRPRGGIPATVRRRAQIR
ncbi:MAG: cytochrome P450 [Bryobacterales bacterium]|nr:cytochrome P450 [Bryobacterales bacterium]